MTVLLQLCGGCQHLYVVYGMVYSGTRSSTKTRSSNEAYWLFLIEVVADYNHTTYDDIMVLMGGIISVCDWYSISFHGQVIGLDRTYRGIPRVHR